MQLSPNFTACFFFFLILLFFSLYSFLSFLPLLQLFKVCNYWSLVIIVRYIVAFQAGL